jgi:hypothetical protein
LIPNIHGFDNNDSGHARRDHEDGGTPNDVGFEDNSSMSSGEDSRSDDSSYATDSDDENDGHDDIQDEVRFYKTKKHVYKVKRTQLPATRTLIDFNRACQYLKIDNESYKVTISDPDSYYDKSSSMYDNVARFINAQESNEP